MDPVGPQKSKFPTEKNVLHDRKGEENTWESNAPKDLGGGFNEKSGSRKGGGRGSMEDVWQGTVKGKTIHTYGVDGKNVPDRKHEYKNVNNIKQRDWELKDQT